MAGGLAGREPVLEEELWMSIALNVRLMGGSLVSQDPDEKWSLKESCCFSQLVLCSSAIPGSGYLQAQACLPGFQGRGKNCL